MTDTEVKCFIEKEKCNDVDTDLIRHQYGLQARHHRPKPQKTRQRTSKLFPLSHLVTSVQIESPTDYHSPKLIDQIHGIFDNCNFITSSQPPHIEPKISSTSSTEQEQSINSNILEQTLTDSTKSYSNNSAQDSDNNDDKNTVHTIPSF